MIEQVLHSHRLLIDDARRMVHDLTDDQMRLRPSGLNPPAWILGHLTYSAHMMGSELGLPPSLPDRWAALFQTGSLPSEQAHYPSKLELLDSLESAHRRLASRLNELGDDAMAEPLPDERCRPTLPTLGHAIIHILAAHTSLHLGQLSAWRRAMLLSPPPPPDRTA